MDGVSITDVGNSGFKHRYALTVKSNIMDLEGPLMVDIAQQNRWILNGVEIQIKLWQSNDAFRLLTANDKANYKLEIIDTCLKVCKITPSPIIMLSHAQALSKTSAKYPYFRTQIKSFNINAGNGSKYCFSRFITGKSI